MLLSLTIALFLLLNNMFVPVNVVFQEIYYLVYINNIICQIINILVGQVFARG